MTASVSKNVEAQAYAFFAAVLVAVMLLAGFFIDSADDERRQRLQTELALVGREVSHIVGTERAAVGRAALQQTLRDIAVDHELSYLAISEIGSGDLFRFGAPQADGEDAESVVAVSLALEGSGWRNAIVTLERNLGNLSAMRSVTSHVLLSLAALVALVAAAWAGLHFFVVTRSSRDLGGARPFSPLAAIASPFLRQDHPDFAALRPDQVAAIVRQSGFTMALVLANGGFLVGCLWSQVPHQILIPWAVFVAGIAILNLRVWLRNRNRPLPDAVSKRTLRRMTYQAGLLGLAWGIALTVFFTGADTIGRFVLIALGLGMAAGGTAALASVPSAALVYTGSILVPGVLRFATLDGDGFGTLAVLCILYTGSMGAFLGQAYHGFARNVLARQAQARQAETIALVLNTYEEQASDWLWETDSDGRLQSPPHRMELLFGGSVSRLADCRFEDLRPKGQNTGWSRLLEVLSTEESFRDLTVSTQDIGGQDRWISLSGRKREDGCWYGVGSDVTVRETALIQLRTAMEEAKSASRATTAFLAATSHELRTPLNAIIGFSQVLASKEVSADKSRDYIQTINGAGLHLLNIVNGILEMAQIEAGHKKLRYDSVDLADAIKEATDFLEFQSEKAGVKLRFEPGEADVVLRVDRQALRQVFLNVLGNAVKFTPSGGSVTIGTSVQGDRVSVSVQDTGIGIAEADIDRILQPFTQVDDGLERRYDGTGLGLPIAKSLIELHGGDLAIASDPGKGTKVTMTLPRAHAGSVEYMRSG